MDPRLKKEGYQRGYLGDTVITEKNGKQVEIHPSDGTT